MRANMGQNIPLIGLTALLLIGLFNVRLAEATIGKDCYNITENPDFLDFIKDNVEDHEEDIDKLMRLPLKISNGDNVFYKHEKFWLVSVDYGVNNVTVDKMKINYEKSQIELTKVENTVEAKVKFYTEVSFNGWLKSHLDSPTIPGKVFINGTLNTYFSECVDEKLFDDFDLDHIGKEIAKYVQAKCIASKLRFTSFQMAYDVKDRHWLVREVVKAFISYQTSAIEQSLLDQIPPHVVSVVNEFLKSKNIKPPFSG
eukprot:Nk52_evm39s2630 gene=Nk52_evmTU39s2630